LRTVQPAHLQPTEAAAPAAAPKVAQEPSEEDYSAPPSEVSNPRPGAGGEGEGGENHRATWVSAFSQDGVVTWDVGPARSSLGSDEGEDGENKRATWASTFSQAMFIKRQRTEQFTRESMALAQAEALRRHQCQGRLAHFLERVNGARFESVFMVLILTNALYFGIETEYMARTRLLDPPPACRLVSLVYTVVFTVELLLRLLANGRSFFLSRLWRWNVFDLLIVLTSWVELSLDAGNGSGGHPFSYVRIIRIIRTVRVLRVVRLMKYFRSLRILVYSVLNTLRSLFWTLLLLLILLYVFGIVFTQAATVSLATPGSAQASGELEKHYGTLPSAVYTLFMSISNGIGWEDAVEPLSAVSELWTFVFLVFIAFTHFAVLNVVTGVFCQTAIESASQDQEVIIEEQLDRKSQYTKQLQDVFYGIIDSVSAGQVTLADFEAGLEDERLQAYFSAMEITADDAWSLFKLLANTQTNTIDIDEFVAGCLRLRGHARGIDMHMLMYESRWTMRKLTQLVRSLDEEFATVHGQLEDLRLRLALRPAMPLEAPLPAPAAPLAAAAPGPKEWMTL